jgi:outer membrane protein OmpA-like peptidoglycan-associated protein
MHPKHSYLAYLFLSLLLFISPFSYAQKEANTWYFGNKAGVDFSSGTPVALTSSALSTEEGCVTICDKEGKLLFYTDGIKVWNKNHELMPNGDSLKGHPSSTQSGIVLQTPLANSKKYYLFTIASSAGDDGFCYSVVDLNLAEGLGDVVSAEKNVKLKANVTEKLTAVKHRNNRDSWIIVHEWESDAFLAYLLTSQGLSESPIISKVGTTHKGDKLNTQGYMKLNSDGTNIALALEDQHAVELLDFDNATGQVSNPIFLQFPEKSYTYGIEFSPNGSLLYASAAGEGKVYQFNLQAGSEEAIMASRIEVGKSLNNKWVGALQSAPDGKIYFPIYKTPYLGVINKPNMLGLACEYQNDAVELAGREAMLGLPTFTQSFFSEETASQEINYFNDNSKITTDKTFILKNVLFDFAKYNLKTSSFVELNKVVSLMKQNSTWNIEISGHTDNIGNKSSNATLSDDRAKSVKTYLISQGISETRISFKGYGSAMPVATNYTDEGRAKNRRVEFVFKK